MSLVIAGLIALVTGYSYVGLVRTYGEGGGAFTFLREAGHEGFAGPLSWVLILGYVLTLSVYAYTFGSYLGDVVGLGGWFNRAAALTIIAVLVGVNLVGVGEASGAEVVTVWAKLGARSHQRAELGGWAPLSSPAGWPSRSPSPWPSWWRWWLWRSSAGRGFSDMLR